MMHTKTQLHTLEVYSMYSNILFEHLKMFIICHNTNTKVPIKLSTAHRIVAVLAQSHHATLLLTCKKLG